MTPSKPSERTVKPREPRLAAALSPSPAAQLGRNAMQKRTVQHLGAIGFAVVPWVIWYFWHWSWSGHGAHFQPTMNEHLVALLALVFGAGCSIFALALATAKPRRVDTVVLGLIVLTAGALYCIEVAPLIVEGFRARWTLGG